MENEVVAQMKTRPTPKQLEDALYSAAAKDSAMVQAASAFR
eukprot:CAMPEP_0197859002 /NCGR_PEP_ID=MMETSP1438-20131217/33245_1 /TAXON_ID=1461541 /ORGANISM="Pterosperma sp., Strain CCMP1384" /LENGTH=40 /DNA_ID= /DNA_START= /DNA_END= /DNA_ORIENTATION=